MESKCAHASDGTSPAVPAHTSVQIEVQIHPYLWTGSLRERRAPHVDTSLPGIGPGDEPRSGEQHQATEHFEESELFVANQDSEPEGNDRFKVREGR
jgi:hypothetical protein